MANFKATVMIRVSEEDLQPGEEIAQLVGSGMPNGMDVNAVFHSRTRDNPTTASAEALLKLRSFVEGAFSAVEVPAGQAS